METQGTQHGRSDPSGANKEYARTSLPHRNRLPKRGSDNGDSWGRRSSAPPARKKAPADWKAKTIPVLMRTRIRQSFPAARSKGGSIWAPAQTTGRSPRSITASMRGDARPGTDRRDSSGVCRSISQCGRPQALPGTFHRRNGHHRSGGSAEVIRAMLRSIESISMDIL